MQAEVEDQGRQVEELVAACMQKQGFDYTPVDRRVEVQLGDTVLVGGDEPDLVWGTLEFAQQYGYGISTHPGAPADDPVIDDSSEAVDDPNQEYREAMSESEGAAYDEALWGAPIENDEAIEDDYDWTTAGCYGAAQHKVYDSGFGSEFAGLSDEIDRFWETVQNDPRMSELNASWVSCMADEGHDGVIDIDNATQALDEEYGQVQGYDEEYTALAENWDWEAEPDGPPAPEVDQAALAAFTEKEIAQAVADQTCRQRIDYRGRSQQVDHELQQEFLDAHAVELQAWADAVAMMERD